MDTTDDIVAVEAEYAALRRDPRRPLSRFVAVSLAYGRMLAEPDPAQAAEVYALALDTLHDPPAPAEAGVVLDLIRALRPVAEQLDLADAELDAIERERRLLDHELIPSEPGGREALCRRAAAIHFAKGHVAEGFDELMNGLRSSGLDGLDGLATDLVLAVRRRRVPSEMLAGLENMWVELRRRHFDGNWPLWCLTALGALRLDADDVLTAQMYVRRAESILGHLDRPVAGALVGGWVALAAEDFQRAHDRFRFASNAADTDDRMRLLASAGLGESLICLGRADEARGPLAEAISYDIGDPSSVARCHELLAEIAAAEGRHADAYAHLQMTRRLEQIASGGAPPVTRLQADDELLSDGASDVTDVVDLRDRPIDLAALDDSEPGAASKANPKPTPAQLVIEGLRNGWFDLQFQAIVDNANHRPGAAEGLLLLQHPDLGVLTFDDLVNSDLDREVAAELCLWTIARAAEVLARWNTGGSSFAVVVKIADVQLTPALPLIVRTALARTGARAELLTVEIGCEVADSLDPTRAALLDDVRATGARVGISGFGSDLRSMDTLLRLPVDVVKLDPRLMGGDGVDSFGRRAVETVVALARTFGFQVIAAGIETEQQYDLQRHLGCDGAQGFRLVPPAPEPEFVEQLLHVA